MRTVFIIMKKVSISIMILLLCYIKLTNSIIACIFYPNYPNLTISQNITCNITCCAFATNASNACFSCDHIKSELREGTSTNNEVGAKVGYVFLAFSLVCLASCCTAFCGCKDKDTKCIYAVADMSLNAALD